MDRSSRVDFLALSVVLLNQVQECSIPRWRCLAVGAWLDVDKLAPRLSNAETVAHAMWNWLRNRVPSQIPSPASDTVEATSISTPGGEKSAEDLFCQVAMKKLEAQLADGKSIDQAFLSYFTIASTILPITAGLISSSDSLVIDYPVAKIGLALAFACYLAYFALLILSFRISKWDSRPLLSQWQEVTIGRTEEEMQRWLGNACVAAYGNNEPVLEMRARYSGWGLWLLAGEAAGLMTAVLVPLWPLW